MGPLSGRWGVVGIPADVRVNKSAKAKARLADVAGKSRATDSLVVSLKMASPEDPFVVQLAGSIYWRLSDDCPGWSNCPSFLVGN